MSDTPRTDAAVVDLSDDCEHPCFWAPDEFARALERHAGELAHALSVVLPMVKGYAAEHRVGRNGEIAEWVEARLQDWIDAGYGKDVPKPRGPCPECTTYAECELECLRDRQRTERFQMSDQLKRYKVWMRIRGGMYAQYDGAVSVWAEDDDDAIERAFRDLKRGAFPDYSRSMWKVERVERVMS